MTIHTQREQTGHFADLVFVADSEDLTSEMIALDYLSDNSVILTVESGKKTAQVTIAPHIVKALRDSLNNRYPD